MNIQSQQNEDREYTTNYFTCNKTKRGGGEDLNATKLCKLPKEKFKEKALTMLPEIKRKINKQHKNYNKDKENVSSDINDKAKENNNLSQSNNSTEGGVLPCTQLTGFNSSTTYSSWSNQLGLSLSTVPGASLDQHWVWPEKFFRNPQ